MSEPRIPCPWCGGPLGEWFITPDQERRRIAAIIKARIASGILEPEFSMPAAIAAWIEDGAVDQSKNREA